MLVRKATADEMLKLWGYQNINTASPTAKFFYNNISSNNAVFWTLDNNGELIGELYSFFNISVDKDFADGTTTAYLCAFRIKKEFRGQGLGSKIMKTVLNDLKHMDFKNVTIGVGNGEEYNQRLYQHMGFTNKIKDCYLDPCAMDDDMNPLPNEGFLLLSKRL